MLFHGQTSIRKVVIGSLFAGAAVLLAVAFYQGASKSAIPGWVPVNEPLQSALALMSDNEGAGASGDRQGGLEAGSFDPANNSATIADPQSPDAVGMPIEEGGGPEAGTPISGIAADPALQIGPSDVAGPEAGGGAESDHRLDLNRATQAELETLPGIGPSKAKAIVDYRNKIGAFRKADQLLDVKGIGPKVFERISGSVRVDSPK